MRHLIWVEITCDQPELVLKKIYSLSIDVFQVIYLSRGLRLKISAADEDKISKLIFCRVRKIRDAGIFFLPSYLHKKWLWMVGILCFLFLVFFFSHFMIDVTVVHSSKEIRFLVTKALEDHGIQRFTFRKSFQELTQIQQQILDAYPDMLEWLQIESVGMRYIVRIEQRIVHTPEEKLERCHLVATKSGIVKKIFYSAGEAQVAVDDFVKEGDILVGGILKHQDRVTDEVCASGSVFAEVWYTTHVTISKTYESYQETGKRRWNLMVRYGSVNHLVFRPRVQEFVNEIKHLFSFGKYDFSWVIQKEVTKEVKNYSEEEMLQKALELVDEKFHMQLQEGEEILYKKVLKKTQNDSTMDVEVFVAVLENISKQEEFPEQKKEG